MSYSLRTKASGYWLDESNVSLVVEGWMFFFERMREPIGLINGIVLYFFYCYVLRIRP